MRIIVALDVELLVIAMAGDAKPSGAPRTALGTELMLLDGENTAEYDPDEEGGVTAFIGKRYAIDANGERTRIKRQIAENVRILLFSANSPPTII